MADNTQNEYNFFQFDPNQVGTDWISTGTQYRAPDAKMSNFGALNVGLRMSGDYTRTDLGFKSKDELENPSIPSFIQEAEYDDNPYVAGSTVKHIRNDEFRVMGLGTRLTDMDQPGFDVMDTKAVKSGQVAGKNYPTEGFRSFGGKYDFPVAYNGTL